jgi:hypothetical protein
MCKGQVCNSKRYESEHCVYKDNQVNTIGLLVRLLMPCSQVSDNEKNKVVAL